MIVCDSSQKPLMLFHLVHSVGITNALVFTKSAESTLRLARLFEFFESARLTGQGNATQYKKPVVVQDYSSDLSAPERKSVLGKFRTQEIDMFGLFPCLTTSTDSFLGLSAPILSREA